MRRHCFLLSSCALPTKQSATDYIQGSYESMPTKSVFQSSAQSTTAPTSIFSQVSANQTKPDEAETMDRVRVEVSSRSHAATEQRMEPFKRKHSLPPQVQPKQGLCERLKEEWEAGMDGSRLIIPFLFFLGLTGAAMLMHFIMFGTEIKPKPKRDLRFQEDLLKARQRRVENMEKARQISEVELSPDLKRTQK